MLNMLNVLLSESESQIVSIECVLSFVKWYFFECSVIERST